MVDDTPVSIEATVVRILFEGEDSGWCAIRCRSRHGSSFTAVGPLLGVHQGDELRLSGSWVEHPRFGEQLQVSSFVHITPTTLDGIRRFLASGRIRGIGPTIAERIVNEFEMETLDVIENDPERLRSITGIGPKTVAGIRSSWAKHRGIQQIMVFLTGHGVSPGVAVKVHRKYGARGLEVVRGNPYRLADELYGVGFRTADSIARKLGFPDDAPERLEAGLLFALVEAAADGHVFVPRDELTVKAVELLGTDDGGLSEAIDRLATQNKVTLRARGDGEPAVYLTLLEQAETSVVEHLGEVLESSSSAPVIDVTRAVDWYQTRSGITLADLQRRALTAALSNKVVVITGGPGTGKTTLVRGIIQILERKEQRVLLAAPTGRAAKRLQETTGAAASTIHRMLEFNPRSRSFGRNQEQPLDADVLVIDEVSMLDVELAAHLLRAVPPPCRLVFVGDSDQLPSVGPGNVLADLMDSGVVPVVRLTEVFRQAERSLIVVNAHRVNRGEMPVSGAAGEGVDFFFVNREEATQAADLGIDFATRRIPGRFGLDPVEEIQVLSPMHRGELGVARLNERMQELLTAPGPELAIGARRYRVGDKVMQLRNNYELDIFNGDIGRVTGVDVEERELVVSFDGRPVRLEAADIDDLAPAYACTIHKAQGSEYPAVVVLLHHSHHVMLQRNLLYTAITRGRRLVVVVGSKRALGRAVRNATVRHRHTMLAERLRAESDRG
jgi:exodeoxyribonuclease V alpha subunit